MFDPGKIAAAILDALLSVAVQLWGWLSANTLGFIPTYVLVTILVVLGFALWLKFGTKGLIAGAIAFLAIFELQRRASEPKPSKQWPEAVPRDRKRDVPKKPATKPSKKDWFTTHYGG